MEPNEEKRKVPIIKRDKLTEIRRLSLLNEDMDYNVFDKNYYSQFHQEIISNSSERQSTALLDLRLNIEKQTNSVLFGETSFYVFNDLSSLFSNPNTEKYIKVYVLNLVHLICEKSPKFVSNFSDKLLYSYIFEELKKLEKGVSIEAALPVLMQFLENSPIAFTYLSTNNFLQFLLFLIQKTTEFTELRILIQTLNSFVSSVYFIMSRNEDLVSITNILLNFLLSDPFQSDAEIVHYSLCVLSFEVFKFPNYPHIEIIFNSNISQIVLQRLNESHPFVSLAITEFLSNATYSSNEICSQIFECNFIGEISHFLLDENAFNSCGKFGLRTIYNVLVQVHQIGSFDTSFLQLNDFDEFNIVLNYGLDNGSFCVIQQIIILLSLILTDFHNESVIEYILRFNFFGKVNDLLESNSSKQLAFSILKIFDIIHSVLQRDPEKGTEIKEIIVQEELVEAFLSFAENCTDETLKQKAIFLGEWMKNEIS